MENLTITLPEEHVDRLERLRQALSRRPPGVAVVRAEVMRLCLIRGLQALEQEQAAAINPQAKTG